MITSVQARGLTTTDLEPSRHYKLAKIDLSGEHAFSRDEVISVMTEKERSWYQVWTPLPDFDAQTFTDDLSHIERFYQARGYYGVRVSYDLTLRADEVITHVKVKEGKPVRVTAVETKIAGNAPLPQKLEPSFKLPLTRGDVFDQDGYQAGAQNLVNIYTTHSFAHATVQRRAVVEVGSLQARVWYKVDPGVRCVFGNTSIVGAQRVHPNLVREQLTYKSGEPFDSRKLAASRDAIVGLNVFSAVDVGQETNPGDPTVVPITISLHEGAKHTLSGGIGYNTETQLNAMIGWTDYNFLVGNPM